MLGVCEDWGQNAMQSVFSTSMLITFGIIISVKLSWTNF